MSKKAPGPFHVFRVSREIHEEIKALEEAAMEMGAAERTGDIRHAYSVLAVARIRLYARINVYEKRRRIEDRVTVRF